MAEELEYKKVTETINDFANDNLSKLAQLFPAVVKDGEVDFEALKQELGAFKEVGSEKYELTWAGKQNAKKVALEDVNGKTLNYVPEDSKNPETTENLYIEGDNLEVLKLLRQNYYGAIKMIYIDPPYNTGNDFVYNDNFTMSVEESEIAEGNRDELGELYQVNSKSQNRYHANWLNMMYPRLKVAKDLLTEDGVILISINDIEYDNLKKGVDEIFGEVNYIATLIWKSRQNKDNRNITGVSVDHEYIVAYSKNCSKRKFKGAERNQNTYSNSDNDERGDWTSANMVGLLPEDQRPNCHYDLINPETGINYGKPNMGWRYDRNTMARLINENRIIWPGSAEGRPRRKVFLNELGENLPGFSSIVGCDVYTRNGTQEIDELFNFKCFEFPKPSELIKDLVKQITSNNDIILDFFSGSGTTSIATIKQNSEDGDKRKFILVQLPEKTAPNSIVFSKGYKSICDIGKERIRRAGDKIIADKPELADQLDIGFKVFKVTDTNIKWNHQTEIDEQFTVDTAVYTPDLMDFIPGAKDEDIVYEVMLRQNDVPLSTTLVTLTEIGQRTYLYASSYLVCLETEITVALVDKLAALNPLPFKFIFRDSAFQDDIALKDETFRRLKALIEKNAGTSKKTYTVEFI